MTDDDNNNSNIDNNNDPNFDNILSSIPEDVRIAYVKALNLIAETGVKSEKHLILVEVIPADLARIDEERVNKFAEIVNKAAQDVLGFAEIDEDTLIPVHGDHKIRDQQVAVRIAYLDDEDRRRQVVSAFGGKYFPRNPEEEMK
jgi:hypothetical protein